MTAPDREALLESWRVTSEHLLAARHALPKDVARVSQHELRLFAKFLDHNELELALECLKEVLDRWPGECDETRPHCALAAQNMDLDAHR